MNVIIRRIFSGYGYGHYALTLDGKTITGQPQWTQEFAWIALGFPDEDMAMQHARSHGYKPI